MPTNATRGLFSAPSRTYTPAPPKQSHNLNSTTGTRLEPLVVPRQQVSNRRFHTRAYSNTPSHAILPSTCNNGMLNTYDSGSMHHLISDTKTSERAKSSSRKPHPPLSTVTCATKHTNTHKVSSIDPTPKGTNVGHSSEKTTNKEYPREPKRPGRQRPHLLPNNSTTNKPPPRLLNRKVFSRLPTRAPVEAASNPEVDSEELKRKRDASNTIGRKQQAAGVRPLSPSQLVASSDLMMNNKGALSLEASEQKSKVVLNTQQVIKSTSLHQQAGARADIKTETVDSFRSKPLVPSPRGAKDDYHNTLNWRTLKEMPNEVTSVIEGSCLEPPFSTYLWTQAYANPSEMVSQSAGIYGALLGSGGVANASAKDVSALHFYPKQLKEGYYACIRCRNPVCSPQHHVPAADLLHSRAKGYAVFSRAHTNGLRVEITNIGGEDSKSTSSAQINTKIQRLKPNGSLTFSVFCQYCNGCLGILESAEGSIAASMQNSGRPERSNASVWFLVNSLCLEYIPNNRRIPFDELLVSTASEGNRKYGGDMSHVDNTNNRKPMHKEDQPVPTTPISSESSSRSVVLNGKNETDRLAEEWGLCLEASISD